MVEVWSSEPLLHRVYNIIVRESRGGERILTEEDILGKINHDDVNAGPAEVIKALIVLELLGYIAVTESGKGRNIKLKRRI